MLRTMNNFDDSELDGALHLIESKATAALIVVGIDGFAASGKTTLVAALLERRPEWQVLRLDELQRPTSGHAWENWSDQQCASGFVDTTELEELIDTLRADRQARFQAYDWGSRALVPGLRSLDPKGVLLVEGAYSLRTLDLFDFTAWVTVEHEERMRRIAARVPAESGWQEAWFRGERWRSWDGEPAAHVDVVLSGRMPLWRRRS